MEIGTHLKTVKITLNIFAVYLYLNVDVQWLAIKCKSTRLECSQSDFYRKKTLESWFCTNLQIIKATEFLKNMNLHDIILLTKIITETLETIENIL